MTFNMYQNNFNIKELIQNSHYKSISRTLNNIEQYNFQAMFLYFNFKIFNLWILYNLQKHWQQQIII